MSRFRVARLLQQAREQGVVTIEIHDRDSYRSDLAADLADHLRLQDCIVVKAGDTEESNRRLLARAAAADLRRTVHDGDLVGFSWGRTLVAVSEELADLPRCTLVQLTGTVGNDFTQSPVEVIRRIADRSSVETVAIFSPLFAASEAAAQSLREDPAIQRALTLYDELSLAVLSLGSWDPPITQLASFATAADHAELAAGRARAELAGIFVRDDGGFVEASLTRRRISISPEQLLRTPRVLAVAGSPEKAGAIAAVARSGLITSLITDDRTALTLLRMAPVTGHRGEQGALRAR
jgi:DNA-binding transcriptional regulator LsrR (DeoR family)